MAENKEEDLEDILSEILEKLGHLPGLFGNLGRIIERFHSAISPLISAINNLFAAKAASTAVSSSTIGKDNTGLLISSLDKLTAAVSRITVLLERMISTALSKAFGAPARLQLPEHGTGAIALQNVNLPHGGTGASPPGGSGAAGAAGALGGLAKIAAIGAIVAAALGALVVAINVAQQTFNQLKQYVNLFNPTVILLFQQALDNLGATIGRAFVPIFTTMTALIREFTAILAPVMASLVPVIQQVADIMSSVLLRYFQNFGNAIRAMVPIIQIAAEVFGAIGQILVLFQTQTIAVVRAVAVLGQALFELSGLGVIIRGVSKVFEALNSTMGIVNAALDIFQVVMTTIVETITMLVSSLFPVNNAMEMLTQAIQFVIRNMFVLAVMMAKLVGFTKLIDNLINFVSQKASNRGDVAAQSPQIKNLEQISKDLALASAAAGGAAGGKGVQNQAEFWKKTLDAMAQARQDGVSIKSLIIEIRDTIKKAFPIPQILSPPAPPPSGGKVAEGGVPPAPNTAPNIPGGVVGGIIGGAIFGAPGAFIGAQIGKNL